ncbi:MULTISPECIES: hypothetical protein [unclassified Phenylobacterium]|uniref:hypothetical protein n=1 Tax=unclassified Phenylobacterium TaxID=2640670 RepID=UPI00083AD0E2|nr:MULTISPECIES: hypothetical protein [unclassified Phenylobacterium]
MKAALPIAALALLSVAACDRPKPRQAAPPLAIAPAAAPAAPAAPAASTGLAQRDEMAGFSLDAINEAQDPVNMPATIRAGVPVAVSGFGFDPVAKTPGKAVDIVIDGAAYPTEYGHERADVAAYFKADALASTGFRAALPAVKPGPHTAVVRVVSADGQSYFDGVAISFYAK